MTSYQFYEVLHAVIEARVPSSRTRFSSFPKWYDRELIQAILDKKRAHSVWKHSGADEDGIVFRRFRAVCLRLSRAKYRDYICSVECGLKRNIRSFWSYVKSQRCDSGFPSNLFFNDLHAHNYTEAVNLFSSHFGSVFSDANLGATLRDVNCDCDIIDSLRVSPDTICSIVSNLPENLNSGPDNVPPLFIKRCWPALEGPVVRLFSGILSSGTFPSSWKHSYILPIHKSGDKCDVKNYRPISIISSLPKLLDAFIAGELSDMLLGRLASQQHGFIKGRSTLTNLLVFNDLLSEALVKSHRVDAIYTDMSKAFDRINHTLLLNKIWSFGVRGILFKLMESYLLDRSQAVRIGSCVSEGVRVTSGVPQGSHLGPLLFCIFINDLVPRIAYSSILLYADDVKLYSEITGPAEWALP